MKETVSDILDLLYEDREELNKRIEIIENLDLSKKLNEKEWHEICETPMRTSELMKRFIKNIFPNAEEIQIGCNYAFFKMYGYKIQIPNSRCLGINIATNDWYDTNLRYDITHRTAHTPEDERKKEYYDAIDKKMNWKIIMSKRKNKSKYQIISFAQWFLKYKWTDKKHETFDKRYKEEEEKYNTWKEKTNDKINEMHKKAVFVKEILLPELEVFSKQHDMYYDGWNHKDLKSIFEAENI